MGKYSPVERLMLIPYNTIEGKYVVTGNLSFLSIFLLLYIYKTTNKSVDTYFRPYKPVRIRENTKCEFKNVQSKKWQLYYYAALSKVVVAMNKSDHTIQPVG